MNDINQWLATRITYHDPVWTRADAIMVISYAAILIAAYFIWRRP